jgi:hypothetical protein
MNRILLASTTFALLGTNAAVAKEDETDWSDPEVALEEGEKQYGFNALVDVNKKTGLPHKVAVGSFQIQYTMRTQDADSAGSHWWVEFDDTTYQALTDALYDVFVLSLQAEGYEVVSKEAVLAAPAYAELEGDQDPIYKGKKARFGASGMKLHKTIVGGGLGAKNLQTMPKLNMDLGTDTVLVVRANLGVVDVDKIQGVKKSKGIYPCLCNVPSGGGLTAAYGSADEYPGLSVVWMHGVAEGGKMPNGRMTYNALGNSTMGFLGWPNPMVYGEKVVTKTNKNPFSTKYGSEADVLANAAVTLFDSGVYLSFAQFNDQLAKKKAKLE